MMDNAVTEQLDFLRERANFLKKRTQSFLSVAKQSGLSGNLYSQRDDDLNDDHAAMISGMELGEEIHLLQESLQHVDSAFAKLDVINNEDVAESDITALYQDAIDLLDEAEVLLEECCEVDRIDYANDEIEWDDGGLAKLEDDALFPDDSGEEE